MSLTDKAWSPYVAGAIIGLLQIPTFLLMDTALGASSSYVTVAAHIAALFDSGVGNVKYLASHMWGAKNWWQVAVVGGIAVGAFLSMRLSGARRQTISPVWARAMGTTTLAARAPHRLPRRLHHAVRRPHRRRLHLGARHLRHGAALGRLDARRGRHVRRRHPDRHAAQARLSHRTQRSNPMSVLNAVLIGLATGIVFGFALEKSRVFEPGVIVGQMQLRNFLMLKIFLAAVITGLIVLAVMNGMFGVKLSLKPLLFKADIIGGLILGAGIALAGACPGTTLAQIGAGYRDAIFILFGGIAGALTYGYFDAPITAFFAEKGDKIGFDQLLGLPFWMTAIAFAVLLAAVLWGLETWQSWRDETGADNDGLMQPRRARTSAGTTSTSATA